MENENDKMIETFEVNSAVEKESQSQQLEELVSDTGVKKGGFFSLEGTCSLKRLWGNIAIFAIIIIGGYLAQDVISSLDVVGIVCWAVFVRAWMIHLHCLLVQRFRSIGFNPWFSIIPVVVLLGYFVPSLKDHKENKYIHYLIPCKKLLMVLIVLL